MLPVLSPMMDDKLVVKYRQALPATFSAVMTTIVAAGGETSAQTARMPTEINTQTGAAAGVTAMTTLTTTEEAKLPT